MSELKLLRVWFSWHAELGAVTWLQDVASGYKVIGGQRFGPTEQTELLMVESFCPSELYDLLGTTIGCPDETGATPVYYVMKLRRRT